jgi:cytochrome c553
MIMSLRQPLMLLAVLLIAPVAQAASPARQDYQEAMGKTPDAQRGARLYVTCAGCHRENGRGNLDGSVPLIAGQHLRATVKQLTDYRHAGRWDPRMQHYADTHVLADTQAIADVAAWVAGLDRAGLAGRGDGAQVQRGLGIYAQRCTSCHGRAGAGDATAGVPRIAGQHYAYTLRQFHDAVEGRRPNFPAEHVRMLEDFERDDLVGLADAIARME